ncbi:MAG: PKD domain-containing protein, partial [Candidatus Marinimicrobia bacterium]|nr:PKD domain-containing protein [Candidatus Neomarinimicrobiota bacterium]
MIEKSMLRKLILGVGVLLMLLSFSLAQDFSFSILTGTDLPSEGEYELVMGFSPEATDGYDEGIDQYAPPAPPPPAFDAAIGWDDDRYFIQILYGNGDLSEHVFGVQLQYGENNVINITWDNTGWAALMDSVKLQDAFGGVMINVNMLEETELELTNPAFNLLQLKVYPKNASQNPTADFILDPLEGFAPLSVNFTDQSEPGMGTISLWNWDFGDGGSSIEQNPTHIFTNIGEWTVKLIAENSYGFSDSTTAVVTVNQPYPPNVDFTSDVTEGDMPLTVQFTDISVQGDGELLSWDWDFGDGGSSTEQNPLYVYEESGDFTVSLMVTDEYTLSMTETKENYISVFESLPPIADAGEDQIVTEKRLVALDGSASISVSGDPLTYTWTAPEGIELSDSSLVNPTFVAPDVDESTIYQFSLMVYDGSFYSEQPDTVNIEVGNDFLPIANAGEDQAVYERENVELDGTGSIDEGGEQIFYHWTSPELITLSDTAAVQPTFTAPSVSDTIYLTFLLTVRDEFNDSTDSLEVTVLPILPLAVVGELDTTVERTQVQLDGSGSSSSESDNHYYQWISPASIELSDSTAENPYFIAPITGIITNYQIILFVSDGVVNSIPDTVSLTVLPNAPPVADAGDTLLANQGIIYALQGSAYDQTDVTELYGEITYHWSSLENIELSDITIANAEFLAPDVSDTTDIHFVLVVNDGEYNSEPDTVTITVIGYLPVADAGIDRDVIENRLSTLDGSDSYSTSGDSLTYEWTSPAEIQLSNNNVVNPAFTTPEFIESDPIELEFSLTVYDGMFYSEPDTVILTVVNNDTAVANAGVDQVVVENTVVELNGSGSYDLNNDDLTYNWAAPAPIVLTDTIPLFPTFTAPATGDSTTYAISLSVYDGSVSSEPDTVLITVVPNTRPNADAGDDFEINQAVSTNLSGSGYDSTDVSELYGDLTYLWVTPSEIVLDDSTKAEPSFIAPVVNDTLSFLCVLTVNDGEYLSAPDTVEITVIGNQAPVAHAGDDMSVAEGSTVTLNGLNSTDINGDTLSFLWYASEGISLSDSSISNPTFETPVTGEVTAYSFTLIVNDGQLDSEPDTVIITSHVNTAPIATAGTDQVVDQGTEVMLVGMSSDDFSIPAEILYTWTTPPEIALTNRYKQVTEFTAPDADEDVSYPCVLVVNDGTLDSEPDTVIVTVLKNKPPIVDAGENQIVEQGTIVQLDGTGSSDPNNDDLIFSWSYFAGPDGVEVVLSDDSDSQPTFIAPDREQISFYTFLLVVNDGEYDSESPHVRHDSPAKIVITVNENKKPIANAGAFKKTIKGGAIFVNGAQSSD